MSAGISVDCPEMKNFVHHKVGRLKEIQKDRDKVNSLKSV